MANTLSDLAPTLYSAAKEVAAEPFGAINAINASFDDKGVAVGDTVDVPVAPVRASSAFTPANVASTGTDATAEDISVAITKSQKVDWHLTGEQIRSLENGGINQEWVKQLFSQGMRTLRNEAEVDCASALKEGAGRAIGVAATTPFVTTIDIIAEARKTLADNGAPLADMHMVIDTAAGLNARSLGIIQQADQAGSAEERRNGNLLRQFGFALTESAGVGLHTQGTGTGYLIDDAATTVGQRAYPLDTGSGTIVAGDVVTIAGSTTKFGVEIGVAAPGTMTLNRPGSDFAHADSAAVTVGADYTANVAFERSACVGVMRPPMMPANKTITQLLVSDQFGLTYLALDIEQYGQRTWEIHLAWGFKVVNSEFVVTVMG